MTLPTEAGERFLPSVQRLEVVMHAARRAFDRGDMEAALGQLDVALHLKPEYDAAWLLRGHVLRKKGDSEGALTSFDRAVAINQDSEEGRMGQAAVLHDLGR
ncbi:MAG: tetratricopeptide repeat protein, partial [Thermoplasmata archaeon]|nr:tetratricopeptide repeat protein [Thermoplasmata archaeon]